MDQLKIGTRVRKFKGNTSSEALKKNLGFFNKKGPLKIGKDDNTIIFGGVGAGKSKILKDIIFAKKIKDSEKILYIDSKNSLEEVKEVCIQENKINEFISFSIDEQLDLKEVLESMKTKQIIYLYHELFYWDSAKYISIIDDLIKKNKNLISLSTLESFNCILIDDLCLSTNINDLLMDVTYQKRGISITIATQKEDRFSSTFLDNVNNKIYLAGPFNNDTKKRLWKQTGEAYLYNNTNSHNPQKVVLH